MNDSAAGDDASGTAATSGGGGQPSAGASSRASAGARAFDDVKTNPNGGTVAAAAAQVARQASAGRPGTRSMHTPHGSREHRRRRMRRHGRRAYIRSVYFLPSMATLGNAICGFGAMYVATLSSGEGTDVLTNWFYDHQFLVAAYLIFVAMLFDALDGRLARFARHTTDFGGQLDSLADVISFGAAPAFLALQVFKSQHGDDLAPMLSRLIWAVGALYMSCAAIRLARFNVSNEHGEQHHFSFLGLPSPGAGGAVAAFVLMQQDLVILSAGDGTVVSTADRFAGALATASVWLLPLVVLGTGLLMISNIRYPHIVNRYMRGRRSIQRLMVVLALLLFLVVAHRYALGLGTLAYALWGVTGSAYRKLRRRPPPPATGPTPLPAGGAPMPPPATPA